MPVSLWGLFFGPGISFQASQGSASSYSSKLFAYWPIINGQTTGIALAACRRQVLLSNPSQSDKVIENASFGWRELRKLETGSGINPRLGIIYPKGNQGHSGPGKQCLQPMIPLCLQVLRMHFCFRICILSIEILTRRTRRSSSQYERDGTSLSFRWNRNIRHYVLRIAGMISTRHTTGTNT